MRPIVTLLSLILCLSAPVSAATIEVPGGQPSLQAAIDGASAGDVIRVTGGIWNDLLIDEAVTIVGVLGQEPVLRCTTANPGIGGCDQIAAVTLAGPGSGVVELVNVRIEGSVMDGPFCNPYAGIRGGGFDELRVLHSTVEAGSWMFVTGLAEGADAINVSVPRTVIEDCQIQGGAGDDDGSGLFSLQLPHAGRGVVTSGDLVLADSTVFGGAGITDQIFDLFFCVPDASFYSAGEGGDAVLVGGTLWRSQSTLVGGAGSVVTCVPTGQDAIKPDGVPVVAGDDQPLVGDLQGSGPIVQGQLWNLGWTSTSPSSLLVIGFPSAPLKIGQKGVLFLDPDLLFLVDIPGAGPISLPLLASGDPAFLGLTVGFQVFDPGTSKLGNPVFGSHVDS
jgi:hypothetical protein